MLKIFSDTYRQSQALVTPSEKPGPDKRVVVILVWTALALTIIRYYGNPLFVAEVLGECGFPGAEAELRAWERPALHHLGWWVGVLVLCYLVVPALIVRFIFREKISAYGLHLRGAFRDWWLYAAMLGVMLPLIWYFSSTQSFQARYPFYNPARGEPLWPDFWIWEGMYLLQFVALEFFFRGFMTLGLARRFGYYSVFIMTIPYCMIHFGKPMPETIGAIIAGIVLGTLSLKSRSVFMGVLIHYSIALAMDISALWREGFFE